MASGDWTTEQAELLLRLDRLRPPRRSGHFIRHVVPALIFAAVATYFDA